MTAKAFFISLLLFLGLSQVSMGGGIQGHFSHAIFFSPVDGPYVETYLAINGESINYIKQDDGTEVGEVEIIMIFSANDTIKYYDKYDLKCVRDTGKGAANNYMDIKRIPLPNGVHLFELQFRDKSDKNKKHVVSYSDVFVINYPSDSIQISDIELVQSYSKTTTRTEISKAGFDINPYVSNFYAEGIDNFTFYAEIYNTQRVFGVGEQYLVNYFIESQDSYVQLNKYRRFVKHTSAAVNVLLNKFPLADLPSGNYNLVIEVRDKQNKLITKKTLFFQRSNPSYEMSEDDLKNIGVANTFVEPMTNRDSLKEFIACLHPIASTVERNFADQQIAIADVELMQRFFLNFWAIRNPLDPQKSWGEYLVQVKRVDDQYGTIIKKGYESDRGRVFLQYGMPNSISVSLYEPSSYPYEIWHYYKLENQSNRKFIFYDPSLVTGDYELLHSDAIGEPHDPTWNYKLQKRNTAVRDVTQQNAPSHWGGNVMNLYKNPR